MNENTYLDYWHNDKVKCPHCDKEIEETWEVQSGEDETEVKHTCGWCDKKFMSTEHVEITFSTRKDPCEHFGTTYCDWCGAPEELYKDNK